MAEANCHQSKKTNPKKSKLQQKTSAETKN